MGARGPSPGTGGRPRKALTDKITEGNPGRRRLTVIEFDNAAELSGADMPQPSEMLSATQKDGSTLQAAEIYKITWDWLNKRGCAVLVSPQLLERYSMAAARWIHCETIITNTGYLAKHPTTGAAIASPYVGMSQSYMNQANRLWNEIFAIVRENSTADYSGGTPQDDVMERLLRSRQKG